MRQKTKKTSTDKREGIKYTLWINTKSNFALGGVLLLGFLYLSACNPGLFSNWNTGGYEAGNCFVDTKDPLMVVYVDEVDVSLQDPIITFAFANLGANEVGSDRVFLKSFKASYRKQVLCSQFDLYQTKSRLNKLEEHTKQLETTASALQVKRRNFGRAYQ